MGVVLVVDVANVMGSRPDGWWRDRAGAASRLLGEIAPLLGSQPDGDIRVDRIVAVVEGKARGIDAPDGIELVRAEADGDSAVVEVAGGIVGAGETPLVVTADRGLRARLPEGSRTAGPGWLLSRV